MSTEALNKLLKENPALYKALMAQVACEKSLYKFTETMWEFVEPANPFIGNWHLEAIACHLEAVTNGHITRLLINVPPGTMKSLMTDVFWPAWEWIQSPHMRYLCTSYSASLTERDNIRFRQVITSDLYRAMWGDKFGFSRDSFNITKIGNDKTGWKIATSTSGMGTGERANRVVCIPFNGMILSSDGWLKIGDIVEKRLPVKIAGWNGKKIIWQSIDEYEKNNFRELIELDFGDGSLCCTEDHLIFTSRGYIPAKDVISGDEVWSYGMEAVSGMWENDIRQTMQYKKSEILSEVLPDIIGEAYSTDTKQQAMHSMSENDLSLSGTFKKNSERDFLQSQMPWGVESRRKQSGVCEWAMGGMRRMREKISEASSTHKILFAKMLWYRPKITRQKMPDMRENVSSSKQNQGLLLHVMLKYYAFSEIARIWERKICPWVGIKKVSPWMEFCTQGCYQETRQKQMPTMFNDRKKTRKNPACSSHRLQEGKYNPFKPNNPLSVLPREDARKQITKKTMEKRIIKSVKKSSRKENATYNLRVTACHNYFADGILVHNCDDLHNVSDGESDQSRKTTLQYFTEVLPTRVTDPMTSAMIVIMQRVHEADVSGHILSKDLGYTHLMLPMEFDPDRKCYTFLPGKPNTPFFEDPRTEPGELLFPARMPDWVVERDKKAMGPYAISGQFQQAPSPRGGGIIKRDYWKLWPPSGEEFDLSGEPLKKTEYPVMEYIIASTDTAYTSKQESDYNALAILGVWRKEGLPKIMLMHCWQKRLDFRGEPVPRLPDEGDKAYNIRKRKGWGMLEWTAHECTRFGVDKLLIEGKATGITLAQEVRKVYRDESWSTQLINPKGDKVARVYAIQHIFAEGMMYAPERDWAELAINEFEKFPKGAHDDLVDAISQGVLFLRQTGFALRRDESTVIENNRNRHIGKQSALYDV